MLTISDGSNTWTTTLLIVADGAASATRELLGVSLTSWSYHQQAIVTLIRTEKSHQNTAYQVFNPDGPLAFLPLADPHH
jgi:2-octaprenylphenol hydroxylase